MQQEDFGGLLDILLPLIGRHNYTKEGKLKGTKNGLIPAEIRLSAALRHFAGGAPDDISIVRGILNSEALHCVWIVVDAVNVCEKLHFSYPKEHEKWWEIAHGFQKKSHPSFGTCAGAIDGMLIWIELPTDEQCKLAAVGPKKWCCGRKKKFGMCLQGTCDVEGRFSDVSMEHPALTSDFLAFTTSPMCHLMEGKDFLAPGFSLFGFIW